jgi:ornithine cyclodeaminase/alanine dehydrogenase-like protein (mu-crystallin family)
MSYSFKTLFCILLMQIFDANATRAALPFERLIPALRDMFIADCVVPPRHVHEISAPGGERLTSLLMPAWLEGRCYGIKTINIAPGNAARGLPGLHASYVLFDAVTGMPLALMDGNEITARRTAAASALAASYLAHADAKHLLVVGAGRIARVLPDAYRAVRPIEQVTVWARRREDSLALVAALRDQGHHAVAADDLPSAVRAADIVSCATLATEPLIAGACLRPYSHLDLMGSFTPAMREADDACFADAAIYVDTEDALQKSGDLIGPLMRGVFSASDIGGTLASLSRQGVSKLQPARVHQRSVFKSVGTALEDLAAAMLVWESSSAPLGQQPHPG